MEHSTKQDSGYNAHIARKRIKVAAFSVDLRIAGEAIM
jgi:hypothetical protein